MKRKYKGVYKHKASGKFEVKVKDHDGNPKYIGLALSKEEGKYQQQMYKHGYHWKGEKDLGDTGFGFIYAMTHKETGKMYIGSKQFYHWDGPVGGYKCTDPDDSRWEPKAWKDSGWRTYTSSSEDIQKMIEKGNVWDWRYEVVAVCPDKMSLFLSEILMQLECEVLTVKDAAGEYVYLNKNIARMEFREPYDPEEVAELKEETEKAMAHYYLRPQHCSCGKIVPYGKSASFCSCKVGKVAFG